MCIQYVTTYVSDLNCAIYNFNRSDGRVERASPSGTVNFWDDSYSN